MTKEKFAKIIDQIIKLRNLGNGTSFPDEAASALEMARKLMLRYDIDEAQLSGVSEEIIEITFAISHTSEKYLLRFSWWISKAFRTRALWIKTNVGIDKIKLQSSIRFIGKKADVAVSTFVFAYIEDILNVKADEYYKIVEKKTRKTKSEYSLGFITAVCMKLEQLEQEALAAMTPIETEETTALIVVSNALINTYMDEKYPNRNEGKNQTVKFDVNNYQKGFEAGEKQGIFRGVESKEHNLKEIE